jgi:xylitol oxidase
VDAQITNWGGTHTFRADRVHRPATLGELQRLLGASRRLSAIGSRHSFNALGDGDALVDLSVLASPPVLDHERGVVSVSGSTTYAELAPMLGSAGRALHNMASLPHISVAGAIATGTHGSGNALGGLATAVETVEMISASGDLIVLHRGEPDFAGAVVHLGALGLVTRVTLRTEATYDVAQTVYDGLEWDTLVASFDEVFGAAISVSVFTRWAERPGALWCKHRADDQRRSAVIDGLRASDEQRHPIAGAPPEACTTQGGVPGPWWDRLAHFRADARPSAGSEIQSEFFVDRADSGAALEALRGLGSLLDPVLFVSEIRTVAADGLWMSPCFERDSTAIHFTWRPEPDAVSVAIERVAEALGPFDPRPHWGKAVPAAWRARHSYARLADYCGLRERLDPDERFLTPWLRERLA